METTKKEQIEELRSNIYYARSKVNGIATSDDIAEALYDVGYRKVPDEYCDKPDNICPMCVDDGIALYCIAFNYALEEENYHCKRLKICKQSEVKE